MHLFLAVMTLVSKHPHELDDLEEQGGFNRLPGACNMPVNWGNALTTCWMKM